MPHVQSTRMEMCRILTASRRAVGDIFGYHFCPSPVWDMLLELYVAQWERRPVYLLSLCAFAHIPASTAMRKIEAMERRGYIVRLAADRDRRRTNVALTQNGTVMVERALDKLMAIYRASQSEPVRLSPQS